MPDAAGGADDRSPAPAPRRISVVVSGANRLGIPAVESMLHDQLANRVVVEFTVVRSSVEATDAARQAAIHSDVVVAVGGDGTVADVATGIFGTEAALGIVPAGSTNITARTLGIPHHPAAAIALLAADHHRREIDVGRSESRSFLHIAGAGFDAELFKGASPGWKRRLGWVAYLPAAASALRLPPSRVSVVADGCKLEIDSSLVLVANGGSAVTPQFRLYPGISMDDGWFDLLLFTATSPAAIAKTLALASRQRLDRSPHVLRQRVRTVRIEADPAMSVQLDGDPRGQTPREFQLAPAAMRVVVPRS